MFSRSVSRVFALLVSLFVLLGVADVAAAANDLLFYKGNNCTGDIVAAYDSHSGGTYDNCKKTRRCENDEARSLKVLPGVPTYKTIKIADSPKGTSDDDTATIKVYSSPTSEICVSTFEKTSSYSGDVYVTYYEDNGLDGKVSFINIY